MQKSTNAAVFFGFTAVTVLLSLFIQLYSARIYSNPTSTIIGVVVIVLIGVALDLLTRARVNRQAQLLEFEG
jgi:uncharacterized membrane protein YjjP (DUF1212 family)